MTCTFIDWGNNVLILKFCLNKSVLLNCHMLSQVNDGNQLSCEMEARFSGTHHFADPGLVIDVELFVLLQGSF